MQQDTTPTSTLESLKEQSLKAAGYGYLLGDASLFASGMMSGRRKEALTGLLWGIGGLVLARYGSPDARKRLELLYNDLGDYLVSQGIAIPEGSPIHAAMKIHDGGVVDNIEQFFYRYPSQTLNALYAVGSAQLLASGLQHGKGWDAASGALVGTGALGGLLIPERKRETQEEQGKKDAGGLWAWLQEKPLRASGYCYMANNVTLTLSALNEMRANPAQKSYWFKFLTVGSYVGANALLAMSSKDNVSAKKQDEQRQSLAELERVAAEVIAYQPPERRAALVEQLAGFLSAREGVGANASEIAQGIAAALAPGTVVSADAIRPSAPTHGMLHKGT